MTAALIGLAAAAGAFPWVFRARWGNFWARMSLVAGSLGLLAAWTGGSVERKDSEVRLGIFDLVTGLASAALLYGVFQAGDRLTRLILPTGSSDIARIYRLRRIAPRWVIGTLLVGIIAPSEELFWRGLLQRSLMRRLGTTRGTVAATLCYAGVHLGAGNVTLAGAAAVAGAVWSAQYALQRRLPALILSHVIWDVWIFLVAPTPGGRSREAESE